MKPCKLTMKAFGCYVNETVIDFDKFKNGIYLITGDTGAGKTTIFDAIMFALYSDVSGTDSAPIMKVRSDYVDDKAAVPTEVELEFLHQGRRYRITRTIPVVKDRVTKHYKPSKTRQAHLVEVKDGATIPLIDSDKDTIVTQKVQELLGINREQFAQIIMLPQGEFKKFLQANSEKKGEILSRVFDSSIYERFQNILGTASEKLYQERKADQEAIRVQMENVFIVPDGTIGTAEFAAENDDLEKNLSALLEREKEEHKNVQEKIQKLKSDRDACIAQKTQAENDNNNLLNLDNLREKLALHTSKAQEMGNLRIKYNRVHDGVIQVLPIINSLQENRQSVAKTKNSFAECQVEISRKEVDYDRALLQTHNNPEKNGEINKLGISISEISNSLPKYKELKEEQAKQVKASQEKQEAKDQLQGLTDELNKNVERQSQIQKSLEPLEQIDVDLTKAEMNLNILKDVYHLFAGEQGFIAIRNSLLNVQSTIKQGESRLKTLEAEYDQADIFQKEQKINFYQSQAFNLAKELQEKMQTAKEILCPVCGQMTANDERFAEHLASFDNRMLVTKEDVENAEKAFENCRSKAESYKKQLENKKLTLENNIKSLSQRAWDALKNLPADIPEDMKVGLQAENILLGTSLSDCQAWIVTLGKEANKAFDNFKAQKNQKTSMEQECTQLQKNQEQLKKNIEETNIKLNDSKTTLEVSGAVIQKLSEKLVYKNEEEAQENMQALQKQRDGLQNEVNASQNALADADKALSEEKARLKEIENNLSNLKQQGEDYLTVLNERLEAYNFANEAAVLEEITVDGQQLNSASPWLSHTQKALTDYESNTTLLRERIDELTKATEGKEIVDLGTIKDKIAELTAEVDVDLGDKEKLLSKLVDNHTQVLKTVMSKRQKLLKSDRAYKVLKKLAGIATGDASSQGKIDFDRFIKGEIFREVLRFANVRLDKMTGGARELVHRIEGDRANAKAGLDLDIYDAETDTKRSDTSLSGGESFMASLSLALGLSDVVKSRMGGMKIDSLFIDEGFGTLDDDKLDRAVEVLNDLTEGDCLVGVISHVGRLEESIAQKLHVKKTPRKGSTIECVL